MDESWRNLEGTWDRLRWARQKKFTKASEAAIAVGEEAGTYRSYERPPGSSKWSTLDPQQAFHFAKKFGVRWEWLLLGQGEPFAVEIKEDGPEDRVMKAMARVPEEKRADIATAIEALLRNAS